MDVDSLVENVKQARKNKLDRLGSDRRLLAVTGTDLTEERVLLAAVLAERAAMETFRSWAAESADPELATAFQDIADQEADHFERLNAERADSELPDANPGALHEYLRGLSASPAQVGAGLIGRPLVGSQTQLQFVNFFLNEADRKRAELFRTLRADTEDQLAIGQDLLSSVCSSPAELERARAAATEAIDVAYREYAAELNEIGLDAKSIC